MYKALNPGAIGVQATTLPSAIAAAQQGGFEGVEFNVREVADLVDQHGVEYVKGLFAEANLKPAGWSVGIDWRSEARWQQGLNELSRLAAFAHGVDGQVAPIEFDSRAVAGSYQKSEDDFSLHGL